ncbi:MAG TPA: anaerobic ribonucleoside-triphosphate reductase [Candidatus Bathyarchaeia archaeon]|nr:anaerobic ribonucleoside-triphosphate reductase [Candidatus Bathyarchaeia archaeon]
MQKSYERFTSEVLDAASAPVRLHILRLLTSKGPLPYTEIMYEAKLDPVRDAGKFVYHLKTLRKAGLVATEKGTKKYTITELGKILVDFSRDLEEYAAVRRGKLFIRTSKMTIEEFDRSKIAKSLVTEAGMPQSIAGEIAAEAEERLLRFGTTYLTAPLVRELVNTILVERKLEEYRHKLTRLGLPVNDVTMLLRNAGQKHLDSGWVQKSAGSAVTGEYVLLQSLTKPLADAHLSGRIHLEETESWVLKPSQFFHDPRPFFQRGLPGSPPATSLESVLGAILKLVRVGEGQISGEQTFDHFNILLAPYIKGVPEQRVQESIRIFLQSLNWDGFSNLQPPEVTLGLDRYLPENLKNQPAIGPNGRKDGVYSDFSQEAEEVLRTLLACVVEIFGRNPVVNPALILKLPRERLSEPDNLTMMAYETSSKLSVPNYLVQDQNDHSTVSSEGCVFSPKEAELDMVRGPIIGTVIVNLPRAAYEASGRDEKLFQNVQAAAEEAAEALALRSAAVKDRIKEGLLPLLAWETDGTAYYAPRTASAEVGLLGLSEAVKHHTHADLGEKDSVSFAKKMIEAVRKSVGESEPQGFRIRVGLHPSGDASSRLAGIDAETFGFSTIKYQGLKK